jgi:hypothetical protein
MSLINRYNITEELDKSGALILPKDPNAMFNTNTEIKVINHIDGKPISGEITLSGHLNDDGTIFSIFYFGSKGGWISYHIKKEENSDNYIFGPFRVEVTAKEHTLFPSSKKGGSARRRKSKKGGSKNHRKSKKRGSKHHKTSKK